MAVSNYSQSRRYVMAAGWGDPRVLNFTPWSLATIPPLAGFSKSRLRSSTWHKSYRNSCFDRAIIFLLAHLDAGAEKPNIPPACRTYIYGKSLKISVMTNYIGVYLLSISFPLVHAVSRFIPVFWCVITVDFKRHHTYLIR